MSDKDCGHEATLLARWTPAHTVVAGTQSWPGWWVQHGATRRWHAALFLHLRDIQYGVPPSGFPLPGDICVPLFDSSSGAEPSANVSPSALLELLSESGKDPRASPRNR